MKNRFKVSAVVLFLAMLFFVSCEVDSGPGDDADLSAPTPGTDITFTNIASDSVTVSWGIATDDSTAQDELSYKLVMAATAEEIDTIDEADALSGDALILDWAVNTITDDVTGLNDNTSYYFAILVKDNSGNASIYSPQTVKTMDATAPTPGAEIDFNNITANSITVTWWPAEDESTAQDELSYKLVMAATSQEIDTIDEADAISGDALILDWAVNTISCDVTGLTDGMNYYFAVLVQDSNGNKSIYSPTMVSTPDITVPASGDEISFEDITSNSVAVGWGYAADNSTLQNQLSYKLVMAATAEEIDTIAEADAVTGTSLVMDWTVNCNSYVVNELAESTSYYFAVLVQDSSGNKSLYAPQIVTTLSIYAGTWIYDEDFTDEYRKQTLIITGDQITFIKEWRSIDGVVSEKEEWIMELSSGGEYNGGMLMDLSTVSAYMTLYTNSLVEECNSYGDCVDGAEITTWVVNVRKNITSYVNDNWYDIIKVENDILYMGDGNCNKWSNDSLLGSTAARRYTSYDITRGFTKE
ncbi:MAG: hypothetical protein CVV44_10585 [Spirochaetae bacterium HGW-Spirochaetae-1]|jgi:uncharacterized protein YfiM (DUF2279 family)|nr:MAG: hypothetical protein CVV44_10585 [Spirochaetae bacterium HGW-Spirochaetae-1]